MSLYKHHSGVLKSNQLIHKKHVIDMTVDLEPRSITNLLWIQPYDTTHPISRGIAVPFVWSPPRWKWTPVLRRLYCSFPIGQAPITMSKMILMVSRVHFFYFNLIKGIFSLPFLWESNQRWKMVGCANN